MEFVQVRGDSGSDLFHHKDGSPLMTYQFWTMTSPGLQAVGIVGLKFGTHSFRIGAASTAAALGYGKEQIKEMGKLSHRFKSGVCSLPL